MREELLASFHDALIKIHVGFSLRDIQLCLLEIFRNLGLRLCLKSRFRRSVGAFVVERRGLKIAVFESSEQLTCSLTCEPR